MVHRNVMKTQTDNDVVLTQLLQGKGSTLAVLVSNKFYAHYLSYIRGSFFLEITYISRVMPWEVRVPVIMEYRVERTVYA